jgi:putative hydrolase of the HAD superfamily
MIVRKRLFFVFKFKNMKLSEAKCRAHSQIKNIILDWGGVITDVHFRLCAEAFGRMGFRFDWSAVGTPEDNIFTPYETGRISTEQFMTRLKSLIQNPVSDQEIKNTWNLVLGDLPAERWEILEKLKGRYRMFLLSNTNALHVEYYTGYLKKNTAPTGISTCLNGLISHMSLV